MNRERRFNEKPESPNLFKNGMRGTIKSNEQIDSFLKSQEVYKLMQNNLGAPSSPLASKSFRIPRKQSPPRNTFNQSSNFRNANDINNSRDDRRQFNNEISRQDNSRYNEGRTHRSDDHFARSERSRYESRRDERSSASFNSNPRKRFHEDSHFNDRQSAMPTYQPYNEFMNRENSSLRASEKSESINRFSSNNQFDLHNQSKYPRQSEEIREMNANSSRSFQETPEWNKSSSNNFFSSNANPMPFDSSSSKQQLLRNGESQEKMSKKQRKKLQRMARGQADMRTIDGKPTKEQLEIIERRNAKKFKNKLESKRGQPTLLQIKDMSHPTGNIAEKNVQSLKNAITNILKKYTLVVPKKKFSLKFFGFTYSDEKLFITCGDYLSREYLSDEVKKLKDLWEGSSFQCKLHYGTEHIVDVLVPKTICHISEFRALCEENHSELQTNSWRLISCEKAGNRKKLQIGMDTSSYGIIRNKFNGVVSCGETSFEFVLKTDADSEPEPEGNRGTEDV